MATYISFLRGINVSGKNMIGMADLKKLFGNLGFTDIQTYVQSGNVIFRAENTDPGKAEKMITEAIRCEFSFEVPVIVLTPAKLERIINGNPFRDDPGKDPSFMHVTFLASAPAAFDPTQILAKKAEGEEIAFSDEAVYLFCPNGYGNTKLSSQFLENKLGVTATTRNWRTTMQLREMKIN